MNQKKPLKLQSKFFLSLSGFKAVFSPSRWGQTTKQRNQWMEKGKLNSPKKTFFLLFLTRNLFSKAFPCIALRVERKRRSRCVVKRGDKLSFFLLFLLRIYFLVCILKVVWFIARPKFRDAMQFLKLETQPTAKEIKNEKRRQMKRLI